MNHTLSSMVRIWRWNLKDLSFRSVDASDCFYLFVNAMPNSSNDLNLDKETHEPDSQADSNSSLHRKKTGSKKLKILKSRMLS